MNNYRLYEIPISADIDEISKPAQIHKVVAKLKNIIKNSFYATEEYEKSDIKQDIAYFIDIYKFLLLNKLSSQNVDIIKVFDRKTDNVYLLFEDVFKEKCFFVVYNLNVEAIVLSSDKMIELLSGRGVPEIEQSFDWIQVKREVFDKSKIVKISLVFIFSLVFIIITITILPMLIKMVTHKKPEINQQTQQQKIYTKEELLSVKIDLWDKLSEKWNEVIYKSMKEDGMFIQKINVNISNIDNQTSKTGFNIEVTKAYIYPEINTKKENDFYVKTEIYNENLSFSVLKNIETWDIKQCLKVVLEHFEVSERGENFIIFLPTEFELSKKAGINFVNFLRYLQKECGYNLEISGFGIDSDREIIYVSGNVKLNMD